MKCPLDQFNYLMSSQYKDYFEGCGLNLVEIKTETKTPKWVWVLLSLSIAITVISLVFGCFAYFKWKRLVSPEE
jgi:heme/copper-type cytochrome/quinol oxidase subunit 2